ncbi:phosphate ABC transporter ATP-binding protein PstB [Oscillochloris sp. ZM17-4]|uniref:phosphate ABC transporter ATP-binding protein PstB n=1 Tax=Oscillochloris sp. ZM17-4 TaxID=2866714 RepID=UPI001C73D0C1|nr:phosphate ABC transporter ATP-binding protein PstB [Oscillochloris sp. ZM17-4]MBX0327206.1 phosphate ABC transporter ATP-binding protein PstB [Oscillochloris sp. ZM17-4]
MSEQTSGHRTLAVRESSARADAPAAIEARDFNFYYGDFRALEQITMLAPRHQITALIGPSGAGKSTLLRAMNRMHDETPGVSSDGQLLLEGADINGFSDLIDLRKRVGMIFQRPNPFPMSIFDNVAYGLRLKSQGAKKGVIAEQVEQALRGAAIWDEVKDKLQQSGLALSGGQQQRLCIARAIAVEPEVLLMDEPCAALDPIATLKIEELMGELEERYTIVIVTHNLQQAGRVSDQTVFLSMNPETRAGFVVEVGPTQQIFTNPKDDRTLAYISGRFG